MSRVLLSNAAFGVLCGVICLVWARPLAVAFGGLPPLSLTVLGVGLLLFAAELAWIARRLQVEGDVLLSVLVDENGKVVDVRILERVRQNVGINEAAVAAARRAKYQPATKDGVRVKMWTNLRLPFRL